MKTLEQTPWSGWKLGLTTLVISLLGVLSARTATYLIVNETYDPPTLATPGGWWDNTVDKLSREYVSEGVAGSTALQISAKFKDSNSALATGLFQTGLMGGNEWATRANSVLSFDIKIDRPGVLNLGIMLEAWKEYGWGTMADADYSASVARIPLGQYTPGVFKKVVVPLNSPLWEQYPFPGPHYQAPLFDPSGRTYNGIDLMLDWVSVPDLEQFTLTVDNVQVSTKTAMIPFSGRTTGTAGVIPDGSGFTLTDHGFAEHIGNFEVTYTSSWPGIGTVELTAANGDKLVGSFLFDWETLEFGVRFAPGSSGRFNGVVGSYRGVIRWDDPAFTTYTTAINGGISTVGSNRE